MIEGVLRDASGQSLVSCVYRATNSRERMRGLIGRPLSANQGFWLEPCNSVHTWFMSYPIDVLFLDKHGVILKLVHELRPWKISAKLKARATLELFTGSAATLGLAEGQKLFWYGTN